MNEDIAYCVAYVPTTARTPTFHAIHPNRCMVCLTPPRRRTFCTKPSRQWRHTATMQMNGDSPREEPPSTSNGSMKNESSSSAYGDAYDADAQPVDEGDGAMLEAEVRDVPSSELKCELLAALASTNRGLAASPEAKTNVESLIAQLERAQPCKDATEQMEMFTGRWRLLYTNALDVLSLGLLSPLALVSEVYQNIYEPVDAATRDFDVENVVEFEPVVAPVGNRLFGRTMTRLVVKVSARKSGPNEIELIFEEASIKQEKLFGIDVGSRLPALRAPLRSVVGKLETTFLDEDLRIGRTVLPVGGNRMHNVFVLFRDP